jgi:hypothetical protein
MTKSLRNWTLGIASSVCLTAPGALADETDGYVLIATEAGDPLYAADAEGRVLEFIYGENGEVLATVDESGAVTDWQQLFAEAEAACEVDGCS